MRDLGFYKKLRINIAHNLVTTQILKVRTHILSLILQSKEMAEVFVRCGCDVVRILPNVGRPFQIWSTHRLPSISPIWSTCWSTQKEENRRHRQTYGWFHIYHSISSNYMAYSTLLHGLSTTYHRLVLSLCIADIVFHLPLPYPIRWYQKNWNMACHLRKAMWRAVILKVASLLQGL
jgi:hypothetical protein